MLEHEVTQMIEKHEKLLGINFVRQNLRGPMKHITNTQNLNSKTLSISIKGTKALVCAGLKLQEKSINTTISFVEKPPI